MPSPRKFKLKVWHPRESDEQAVVFDWAKYAVVRHPELAAMYAIPNGAVAGPGRFATVNWMKSQGMKNGVMDICLPCGRAGFLALYIEQKVRDGVLSPAQKDMADLFRTLGNKVETSWSANETIAIIESYLAERKTA